MHFPLLYTRNLPSEFRPLNLQTILAEKSIHEGPVRRQLKFKPIHLVLQAHLHAFKGLGPLFIVPALFHPDALLTQLLNVSTVLQTQ